MRSLVLTILGFLFFTTHASALERVMPGFYSITMPDGSQKMFDYILIEPRNLQQYKKYPLFVFMHGLGVSANEIYESDSGILLKQQFYILIPQGPIKYEDGYSWYSKDSEEVFLRGLQNAEFLINECVKRVIQEHNIDSSKVVLSGFSQGGRLSFYIGIKNPQIYSEIIPVGGAYMDAVLDPYLDAAANMKINIYHGEQDDRNPFSEIQAAYEKLKTKISSVNLRSYSLGHTYTTDIFGEILDKVNEL